MPRLMLVWFLISAAANACVHPQVKYRKGRLLDPMMDPAKTEGFQSSFLSEPYQWNEHGSGEVGGALGGSCPTCGG